MESLVDALTNQHLFLILFLLIGTWWIFQRVRQTYTLFREFVGHELEERLPNLLKRELQNGLGDIVESRMQKLLNAHEQAENERLDSHMREVRAAIYREGRRGGRRKKG